MTHTTTIKNKILADVKELPLPSPCASQLIATINNSNHSRSEILEVIKHDAGFTAEILRLVNSALYSFPAEITSLDRAILLMGEDVIAYMAVNSAASSLTSDALEGYHSEPGELWRHDLKTAIASKKVAALSREAQQIATAFTGGLLHDIGKSLLSKYMLGASGKILKAIDQGKLASFQDAEAAIFGLTHSIIGYEVAIHWGLPEPLPSMIRFHHAPAEAPAQHQPLVYAVHLGDIIAMMSGCGTGADTLAYTLDEGYVSHIDISKEDLLLIMLEVEDEFTRIQNSLYEDKEEN